MNVWRAHRVLLVSLGIVVLWLGLGAIRAPAVARDYFTRVAGEGATVTSLNYGAVVPFPPPFWYVAIDGLVQQAGTTGPGYHGAELLLVEPISGWVLVLGAG